MSIQTYQKDVDKFLVEITLTAACYGLVNEVSVITRHLMTIDRAVGPALLANGLARIVAKQYPDALVFLDTLLAEPKLAKFHGEAHGFKALALKLKGDKVGLAQQLLQVDESLAKALSA